MAGAVPPSSEEENSLISEINVTPFVDVVLVLLVIFIITAPIIAKNTLVVKLPKASQKDATAPDTLGVIVTRQGQILLDGKVMDDATFLASIQDRVSKNPDLQGIIGGDEESRHKDLVHAIDLMKRAGLQKFGFQVEAQKNQNP